MTSVTMNIKEHFPKGVTEKFEVYDYNHAVLALKNYYTQEYSDICDVLTNYTVSIKDILASGGSESNMPKLFKDLLLGKKGWDDEISLTSKEVVEVYKNKVSDSGKSEKWVQKKFSHGESTHKIDYMKNDIAIDYEWNSKDQTFDRDLFAFSSYFNHGIIKIGVIITRDYSMQKWIMASKLTYLSSTGKTKLLKEKFGASTTHMNKLIPRLEGGRHGGCPVIVFGMTPDIIIDR